MKELIMSGYREADHPRVPQGQWKNKSGARIPKAGGRETSTEEILAMTSVAEQRMRDAADRGDIEAMAQAAHDRGQLIARFNTETPDQVQATVAVSEEARNAVKRNPALIIRLSDEFESDEFGISHGEFRDMCDAPKGEKMTTKAALVLESRMDDMGLVSSPDDESNSIDAIRRRNEESTPSQAMFGRKASEYEAGYGQRDGDMEWESAHTAVMYLSDKRGRYGKADRDRIGESATNILDIQRKAGKTGADIRERRKAYADAFGGGIPERLDDHEFAALARDPGMRAELAKRSDLTPQRVTCLMNAGDAKTRMALAGNTHLDSNAWNAVEARSGGDPELFRRMLSNPSYPHGDELRDYAAGNGISV
jgi:hypothetical protein